MFNKLRISLVALLFIFGVTGITTIITAANAVGDSGKQIIVNNIQKSDAFGKWNNTDYTSFYSVKNLFDNQTNSWSFWGQYGVSGWNVLLEQPLKAPVCSVEIDVYNPKNTPYSFIIGNNETMAEINNNLLDTTKEVIEITDNCIQNVTAMQFMSNAPGNWTTLSEVKLFSNQTTEPGPGPEPPVCPPDMHWDATLQKCVPNVVEPPPEPIPVGNITKLTISNSTVFANITDSRIIMNVNDNQSQIIMNNADIPPGVSLPPPPPPPMTDDQDKEEKEEEEDEKEHEEESKEQEKNDDDNEKDKNDNGDEDDN